MRVVLLLVSLSLPVAALSCVSELSPAVGAPVVDGFSHQEITVGESLYVVGRGFLTPDQGESAMIWSGKFHGAHGDVQVDERRIRLIYDGELTEDGKVGARSVPARTQVLRWNRFGPFAVPFGNGDDVGQFEGTLTIESRPLAGAPSRSEPVNVTLDVKPSLLIRRLEPIVSFAGDAPRTASCSAPALRALGGLGYVLEVEAVGIDPTSFVWQISGINGDEGFTRFTHIARANTDVLGDGSAPGEVVVLNPIPDGADIDIVTVQVDAYDDAGNAVETVLPLDVVRPLQFFYDGNRELAEYYPAEVVNGPIVGGIGTVVTYSESHSESRQHGVSVSLTESLATTKGSSNTDSWTDAYGVTDSLSTTNTHGTSTSEAETSGETYGDTYTSGTSASTNLSSTDGTNWGWNLAQGTSAEDYGEHIDQMNDGESTGINVEVNGSASIPGLAGIGGKVGGSDTHTHEAGTEDMSGHRDGASESRGSSAGGSASTTTGYGSTTTDQRSQTVGGNYALQRQQTINDSTAETDAHQESTVFTVGQSQTASESYTVGDAQTWGETWQSTTTDQSLLSFSGKVPNGRCAVVYRQTVRYVRTAYLYAYDACGVKDTVGELYFNEWSWSPNIAIGDDCSGSLPPSTQPEAQCFLACN